MERRRKYQGPQPQIAAAPIGAIRAGPELNICPDGRFVGKYERLIEKRGNIVPVTATYAENGDLALASGLDVFSAYQNSGAEEIPIIIAETADDSDALLLMLEMMITHPTDHLTVSSCLCRLIDDHMVPRNEIAKALGKSLPWLSLAERVGRRLVPAVKGMLAQGSICMRSAEEIALLPDDVQEAFADQVVTQALNKDQVGRLVSLYTDKACSKKVKDAILNDPADYLRAVQKKKETHAGYALFCRVMQRCRAALHDMAKIIEALPDSVVDDACAQLRELLVDVTELADRTPEVFTRVN